MPPLHVESDRQPSDRGRTPVLKWLPNPPKGNDQTEEACYNLGGVPSHAPCTCPRAIRGQPQTLSLHGGRAASTPLPLPARLPGHLALTLADTSALTLTTRYSSPGTACSSGHKKCRTHRGGTAARRAPRPDSALLLWVRGRHLGGGEPGPLGSSQSQTIATAYTLHLPSHKRGKVWPYCWKTTSPRAPHQLGFAFHNPTAESALLSVLQGLRWGGRDPRAETVRHLCPPVQCAWAGTGHIVSAMIYLKRGVQLCPNEGLVQTKSLRILLSHRKG